MRGTTVPKGREQLCCESDAAVSSTTAAFETAATTSGMSDTGDSQQQQQQQQQQLYRNVPFKKRKRSGMLAAAAAAAGEAAAPPAGRDAQPPTHQTLQSKRRREEGVGLSTEEGAVESFVPIEKLKDFDAELGTMFEELAARHPDVVRIEPRILSPPPPPAPQRRTETDSRSALLKLILANMKIKLYRLKDEKGSLLKQRDRYELITKLVHSEDYINRCYLKLAELDYMFDFELSRNVQVYIDLCAGPGGFSQYLNSKDWRIYGYAFQHHSLQVKVGKLANPTRLRRFTGDILSRGDRDTFCRGVDRVAQLVVADGAVDCGGRENQQESLNLDIIRAEMDIATRCLLPGGKMVIKFFDMYTDETKALVYELYGRFERLHVTKPVMSRRLNAERYIVALGFRGAAASETQAAAAAAAPSPDYRAFEQFLDTKSLKLAAGQMKSLLSMSAAHENDGTGDCGAASCTEDHLYGGILTHEQLHQFHKKLKCSRARPPPDAHKENSIKLVNLKTPQAQQAQQTQPQSRAQSPPLPQQQPQQPQQPSLMGNVIVVPDNYCVGFLQTKPGSSSTVDLYWTPVCSMLMLLARGSGASGGGKRIPAPLRETKGCKILFHVPPQTVAFCTFTWLDNFTIAGVAVHDVKWIFNENVASLPFEERQRTIALMNEMYTGSRDSRDREILNGATEDAVAGSSEYVKITRLARGDFTKCTGVLHVAKFTE